MGFAVIFLDSSSSHNSREQSVSFLAPAWDRGVVPGEEYFEACAGRINNPLSAAWRGCRAGPPPESNERVRDVLRRKLESASDGLVFVILLALSLDLVFFSALPSVLNLP